MSDPKQEQRAEEEQVTEDLTVPEAQAEEVGGGESVSLNYGSIEKKYVPQ